MPVHFRLLRVGSDQTVQVTGLELMGILGQRFQVAHAVVAGPGGEHVPEGQRGQGGISSGAAAVDGQPLTICQTLPHQVQRPVDAVVHVDDAPLSPQAFPVRPAVGGAAPVVDVQNGETPAGPILNTQVQGDGGRAGGAAVAFHQQRRFFAGDWFVVPVGRRVVESVGGQAIFGGVFDGFRGRQICPSQAYIAGGPQHMGIARRQVQSDNRQRLDRGPGDDYRSLRSHPQVSPCHVGIGRGYGIQFPEFRIHTGQLPVATLDIRADDLPL